MRRMLTTLAILSAALVGPACGTRHASGPPPQTATTIQVSPATVSVLVGDVQTLSVTVSGVPDATVVWSVNGIPGGNSVVGTIEPMAGGAHYIATSIPSPDPVTVTAASQADPSVSGSSTVTVEYPNDTAVAQAFPIRLGTSGGNVTDLTSSGGKVICCSGTLGCLVERGGVFFILSNNHVLANAGQGSVGNAITQPGLSDTNCQPGATVASLSQAAPLPTSNVDAALAQIVPGAVDTSGSILDLGPAGNMTIAPAPPSSTPADPAGVFAAGERVAKSGRSSGLTCGSIRSIQTDVVVDYSTTCAGPTSFSVTFHNQIMVDGGTFSEAGDSGSLIVTSDSARPVGLLYAGNSNSTVANPIADVLAALKDPSTGAVPAIVGSADHPVSCAPIASIVPSKPQGVTSTAPTPLEFSRVSAAKDTLGARLLDDPAVTALGIGTSADNPHEGALLVYVRGIPKSPLPHQLGGVRTRIVPLTEPGRAPQTQPSPERVQQAVAIKDRHSAELFGRNGVLGVGVGSSQDAEGELALVVYVDQAAGFPGVDVELEGMRTRVIEGDRFRTFGWGTPRTTSGGSCCGHR
ncbi:MAG TPA: hypothetical protein VKW04_13750 [Planctomycetota bacterium]|nr:hypothetical protein [Planctomycetota bacterium]